MDSGNDIRNGRGIYRTKVRVPWQTIYSRKQKQKLATTEIATSDSRNHSKSQCSENTAVLPKSLAEDSASQSILDSFSNEENAILMLDESSQCACTPTDQNSTMTSDQNRDAASTMLYEGS